MASWRFQLLLLLLVFVAGPLKAADIEVLALFENAALLSVDGEQKLLKVGQTGPQGVRLVAADSRGAKVTHNGKEFSLNLSQHIGSDFTDADKSTHKVLLNQSGQYLTHGKINNRSVQMMIDTGASVVALSRKHASQLGLRMSRATPVQVKTASGVAAAFSLTLESVQLGTINVPNVKAVVVQADYPEHVLIGQSFLQFVELTERGGVMQLEGSF